MNDIKNLSLEELKQLQSNKIVALANCGVAYQDARTALDEAERNFQTVEQGMNQLRNDTMEVQKQIRDMEMKLKRATAQTDPAESLAGDYCPEYPDESMEEIGEESFGEKVS